MDQLAKSEPRLVFITGTDTGVGKTLLTALLLKHLRRHNVPVLAIKPFCSGDRNDAVLLNELQVGELSLDEINPFFFPEPLAPLVAARKVNRSINLSEVIDHVRSVLRRLPGLPPTSKKERQTPVLLIEGAGGLLVPLGRDFSVLDLIHSLQCEVVVVSRNRLGTLNHTLLTIRALQNRRPHLSRTVIPNRRSLRRFNTIRHAPRSLKVVLVDEERPDPSALSNAQILRELVAPIPIQRLPFFAANCQTVGAIEKIEKKIQKTLAQILR